MDYQGVKIEHFQQSGFKLESSGMVIYIDPYNLMDNQRQTADFVFITHSHFDHCSPADLKKIITQETIIVAPNECLDQLKGFKVKEAQYVNSGQILDFSGLTVETVPAYNLDKFRSAGTVYHPKEEQKVGYVLELGGVRLYHAGDTDNIPEMSELKNIDIAFLPVSGTYVMTWQEAVEAAKAIKPKMAIPMHYGAVIGSITDAENFKKAADCPVEII